MPRAALILNSTAGMGCPEDTVRHMREQFTQAGLAVDIAEVSGGEQIIRATERALAAGIELIVAGGGDGTQSAVASRLAGTSAVQGVLPMGTLNHFAKDLGIPLDADGAIALLAQGQVAQVDVGEVNGRTFINNSSIGLYPDIVRDRELQRRRLGKGKWHALASASLHAARNIPRLAVHVATSEGEELVRRTPFVFVGNNTYTMEGFAIGERESVSRGELSLYLTRRTSRFGLFALALRALVHRLEQARDFDVVTAPAFVVHTGHRKTLRVATDGEITMMDTPLHYRVRPGALRVMVGK